MKIIPMFDIIRNKYEDFIRPKYFTASFYIDKHYIETDAHGLSFEYCFISYNNCDRSMGVIRINDFKTLKKVIFANYHTGDEISWLGRPL